MPNQNLQTQSHNRPEYKYIKDFESYDRLRNQYKHNAHMLYALQLRFDIGDINAEASESLTDKSDDKKCDLIYVDSDNGIAVIAQGFYRGTDTFGQSAPANKASDLNTAAAWVLNNTPDKLPETIREQVSALHDAINDDKIRIIYFWYVHNFDERNNTQIKDELSNVTQTAKNALERNFPRAEVQVESIEVGNNRIESWFNSSNNPISLSEDYRVDTIGSGFEIGTSEWRAYVTAVSSKWLHNLYKSTTPDLLFSGNPRDYLGYGKKKNKINLGIRDSLQAEPSSFWTYNNGITALVHDYKTIESDDAQKLEISGITIINGAQTTGTIGSIEDDQIADAWIPIRFIVCKDASIIANIVTNNNRQTEILPSDLRSNDPIQKRLRDDFKKYEDSLFYTGGRRTQQRPSRTKIILDPYKVAQALYAFHVDSVEAYNRRKQLWENDRLYNVIFHERLTAEHIIFTYFLYEAIHLYASTLQQLGEDSRTTSENEQLAFLRKRGAKMLLVSTIRHCLETILGRKINQYSHLAFKQNDDVDTLKDIWVKVISIVLPGVMGQLQPTIDNGLNSKEKADAAAKQAAQVYLAIISASGSSSGFDEIRSAVID